VHEKKIHFYSEGLRLEGSLYLPDDWPDDRPAERLPGVVVCSGYLGLNAIYPRLFAGPLTAAGHAVLGFDYRGNAESEGTPGRLLLEEQVQDIKNGISYLRQRPEVDTECIALVGWGMGAANVVKVAAEDERVRAVAALNGFYNGKAFLRERHNEAALGRLMTKLERDRTQRVTTGKGKFNDPYEVYPLDPGTKEEVAANLEPVPGFGPQTAFELLDSLLALDAEAVVHKISPRPLFIGHGEANRLHPPEGAASLYAQAGEPKTWYSIAGKHNNFMRQDNPEFKKLSAALVTWLGEQLGPAARQ
jgi:alpha-beta hydrolase superfamily lysophospholipase